MPWRALHPYKRATHGLGPLSKSLYASRWPQTCRYASTASKTPYTLDVRQHEKSTFYVTTPIFYPNAAPHIGHLYTLVTADIIARHARLSQPDRPVFFLTGTDEHGGKIQKAAEERHLTPIAFCTLLSARFRELANKANISYTRFIRTTDVDHKAAVQRLWRVLESNGLIRKDEYTGYYSLTDECFYTAEQVDFTGGRPISKETGSVVEFSKEENYMLALSKLAGPLEAHYKLERQQSIVPEEYATAVSQEINNGLGDLSISRPRSRLQWGIPVPGDNEHTIYVWIDALINYLTATGYPWKGTPDSDLAKFWPPDVQVIGKDIVRFHAIYLPAILKALGIPTARKILVHPHWTVDRKKMSKSVGNVVDPFQVMDDVGVDVVRFYLARVGGSYQNDHDWSDVQLKKHAAELRSLLGNVFARTHSALVMKRIGNYREVRGPTLHGISEDESGVMAGLKELGHKVDDDLSRCDIKSALDRIVQLLNTTNLILEKAQPWSSVTSDVERAKAIALSSETLRVCGIVLQPFIPGKAKELLDLLGVPLEDREWRHSGWLAGSVGEHVSGRQLFPAPPKK